MMRAAQCRARQIRLRLWDLSADICTVHIRNSPEFAAAAIHLLKEPFVARRALKAHRLLTCMAISFLPSQMSREFYNISSIKVLFG